MCNYKSYYVHRSQFTSLQFILIFTWFCFLCLCSRSRTENWFHGLPPGLVLWATVAAGWTPQALECCLLLGSPPHRMAGWNPWLKPTSPMPPSQAWRVWQRFCRQSYFQLRSSWDARGVWHGCQRWRNRGVLTLLEGRTMQRCWHYRTQRRPFWSRHKAEQWETAGKRPKAHTHTQREKDKQIKSFDFPFAFVYGCGDRWITESCFLHNININYISKTVGKDSCDHL